MIESNIPICMCRPLLWENKKPAYLRDMRACMSMTKKSPDYKDGAEEKTRTSTGKPQLDPEPSASTNSATSALRRRICSFSGSLSSISFYGKRNVYAKKKNHLSCACMRRGQQQRIVSPAGCVFLGNLWISGGNSEKNDHCIRR